TEDSHQTTERRSPTTNIRFPTSRGLHPLSSNYQPPTPTRYPAAMTSAHTEHQPYQLTLPLFEGPLDLLLHLIEREELDITEIALLAVTDQYMAMLHEPEQLNLDALADFIAIGARLLFLKSR